MQRFLIVVLVLDAWFKWTHLHRSLFNMEVTEISLACTTSSVGVLCALSDCDIPAAKTEKYKQELIPIYRSVRSYCKESIHALTTCCTSSQASKIKANKYPICLKNKQTQSPEGAQKAIWRGWNLHRPKNDFMIDAALLAMPPASSPEP